MAVFAGDRRIGVLDRAKDVEAGFTVHANVFVERHIYILNLERREVNGRLYSFEGYFDNVEGWKSERLEGWKSGAGSILRLRFSPLRTLPQIGFP